MNTQSIALTGRDSEQQQHGQTPHLRWNWVDWVMLGAVICATLWSLRELWKPGIPNDIDLIMSIYRVFELNTAWQTGVFFPRLGLNLNFGYSAPLFQFYPPLVSYGIFFFYSLGLGYITATKLMLSLNFFWCGLGVYGYVRWLSGRRFAALCSALLYLYSPYVLLVTYERGAAAEGMALALLPWLFWTAHRQLSNPGFPTTCLCAVLVALTMLAHNITALFVIPAVALYAGLLAIYARQWRSLVNMAVAIFLGLGLSAFYWIPALFELTYTRAESTMLTGGAIVGNWLLTPINLVQSSLPVLYAGDERFRFGLWLALLGLVALLGWRFYDRDLRFTVALLLGGWLVVLLLQLENAQFIWTHVPMIRFIQFPWRLFGIGSLFLALAVGLLLASAQVRQLPLGVYWLLGSALSFATIFFAMHNIQVETLPYWALITDEQISKENLFERGRVGFSLFIDYTPVGMQRGGGVISQARATDEPSTPALDKIPEIRIVYEGGNHLELEVAGSSPFNLRYHKVFFPGWHVYVDDAAVATTASGSLGLVTAAIPAGAHRVRVVFEQTPLRRVSDTLSLTSLVIVMGGSIRGVSGRRRFGLLVVSIIIVAGVWLFMVQAKAAAKRQPTPYAANLGNSIQLLAYEIEKTSLNVGATLKVRLYWFARETPLVNLKVFVHLVRPDDSGQVAQLDHEPAIGYNPTTRWEPGELIVDEYELPLEQAIPLGTYLVAVGMYDPQTMQNLPVLNGPSTLPGDRMVLTSIAIE